MGSEQRGQLQCCFCKAATRSRASSTSIRATLNSCQGRDEYGSTSLRHASQIPINSSGRESSLLTPRSANQLSAVAGDSSSFRYSAIAPCPAPPIRMFKFTSITSSRDDGHLLPGSSSPIDFSRSLVWAVSAYETWSMKLVSGLEITSAFANKTSAALKDRPAQNATTRVANIDNIIYLI